MTLRRRPLAFALVCSLFGSLAIAPLSSLTSLTGVAHAAPAKPAPVDDEATRLKKQGDQAMLDLHYEDALRAYDASYALRPNPALHYNRGRACEGLGRWSAALDAYEAFTRDAPEELRAKVPGLPEHVREVEKRVSTLTLDVATPGARVVLRDVVIGTAPIKDPLRVNAGKAKLEVSADGYVSVVKELDLPGGDALTVKIELEKKVTGGTLVVRCDPPASVTVDGKVAGSSPLELHVEPGTHALTLSRDGYASRSTTVSVADGDRKETTLTLEAVSGITSKWWFWTGVGVVAVGGAVMTYSLLSSRDAGHGDIAPGRISAPVFRFP
jgi:hypothetical protein